MSVWALGINHHTAPLDLRGRFAFALDQIQPTLHGYRQSLARQPEAKPQVKGNPQQGTDRATLFTRRDLNKDGKLTRDEFLANQPDPDQARERFKRFDANGDGVLSRDEFIQQGRVLPAK